MKTLKKIVALLPMKANSERIPGKNFKQLNSKPLFKWILDTLLSIEEISQVVINTDAENILKENNLVTTDKVKIRQRKAEICGDKVSMNLILADDIENIPADIYLMTHTTNPLLSAKTIKNALNKFIETNEENKSDSLFTVNKFQSRFYKVDGTPINHDPNNLVRTQDLEPWYEENSNLYIFTQKSFFSTNARIGKNPVLFETPILESVDIDDWTGWTLAETLSKSEAAKNEC